MEYTSAIVTGGSGFIGSHLVDALIAEGIAVTVIDWVDPEQDRKNEKATYVRKDIRDADVSDVIKNIGPDVVFHLAAHIDDRASVLNPVMNAEHNELGSIRVFEGACAANVQAIVFASSCAVYGNVETLPVTESVIPRPRTPYGISKRAAELYLDACGMRSNTHTVALRFANVYGPRQYGNKESGAIAIFTEKLLQNVSPFVNNDGKTTRDYVFVHDVVAALMACAVMEGSGVFNVGTGREVTTEDLFTSIRQVVGSDLLPTSRPEVEDALKRICLDTSALTTATDWKAETSLEDGMTQTVEWYREYVK